MVDEAKKSVCSIVDRSSFRLVFADEILKGIPLTCILQSILIPCGIRDRFNALPETQTLLPVWLSVKMTRRVMQGRRSGRSKS